MKQFLKCITSGLALAWLSCFLMGCPSAHVPNYKTSPKIQVSALKGRVIIDPGHGGKDTGAVGARGVKEKDVALEIALRMRSLMRKVLPQVEVVLTRTKDISLSLPERIKIANQAQGDLFISIHINSNESSQASGYEFYSLDVANNRYSKKLADKENIGLDDSALKFILADLRANANRQESDLLASMLAKGMAQQLGKRIPSTYVKDRGYNQALFYVLFVKMPAVLGELFFISNPTEERLLAKPAMRELCARGLVAGVKKYLDAKFLRAAK